MKNDSSNIFGTGICFRNLPLTCFITDSVVLRLHHSALYFCRIGVKPNQSLKTSGLAAVASLSTTRIVMSGYLSLRLWSKASRISGCVMAPDSGVRAAHRLILIAIASLFTRRGPVRSSALVRS